jgi:ubiquitin-protein ligase
MFFGDEYPLQPPTVKFVTRIFHPNVWGEGGLLCLRERERERGADAVCLSPVFTTE